MAKFLDYSALKILVSKLKNCISKVQERADNAYNLASNVNDDYLSICGGETENGAEYRIPDVTGSNMTLVTGNTIDTPKVTAQWFKQKGWEDKHNMVMGTDGVPHSIGPDNSAYVNICPLDNNNNIPTEFLNNVKVTNTIPLTDKINLTTETKVSLGLKYAKVSNNTVNFYVIADSSGNLPSSETRININSDITDLVGAEGANVGDMFVVGKLNMLPVYKIIPLNDAKAENSDYKGTQGVVTPWDKAQINKVANIESVANAAKNGFPTYTESNMNNALKTGFYPWCTLGRPSGSTGAYTLVTIASTTADSAGYTTIEQTAYGRQDELGKIFKRIIFKPSSGNTEYGDWVDVSVKVRDSTAQEITSGVAAKISNEFDSDKVILVPFTGPDIYFSGSIFHLWGGIQVQFKFNNGNTSIRKTLPLSAFNYQIVHIEHYPNIYSKTINMYINLGKTLKYRLSPTDSDEDAQFKVEEIKVFELTCSPYTVV